MKKGLLAAGIGVGAGLLLLGAYVGASQAGIHIAPDMLVVGAAVLAFSGAVAVFALLALERPAAGHARARLLLNEEPATEYVFPFKGPGMQQVVARPEMSVGEMLVRLGDGAKGSDGPDEKNITLTIRGSNKKAFSTLTLQQLFLALKPLRLRHVLLAGEKDDFIGYIPGKRALTEFTGDKGEEKINAFVCKVLASPSESAVLRQIAGVTRDDTIGETEDARHAEAKIWANENVQGLVIHRHLKPVGFISKVDVLRLNAGRL